LDVTRVRIFLWKNDGRAAATEGVLIFRGLAARLEAAPFQNEDCLSGSD
jgi:hypothetical protein